MTFRIWLDSVDLAGLHFVSNARPVNLADLAGRGHPVASRVASLSPRADDGPMDKIAPNLKTAPTPPQTPAPTVHEALHEAIEAALPELERWGPGVALGKKRVGHGARVPDAGERAEELTARALAMGPNVPYGLEPERVREAQAIVNTLFAGYYARPLGARDESAETALRGIVERAETWQRTHEAGPGRATAAMLMSELPEIYGRVQKGELDDDAQEIELRAMLRRSGLEPSDPKVLERVLHELACDASFFAAANSVAAPGDRRKTIPKAGGAVETAAYTLSVALDVLGVAWPHRRGALLKARAMTDRERVMAMAPGPFGTRVGPVEAVGYAERAAFRRGRSVEALPLDAAAAPDEQDDGGLPRARLASKT